ncbi:MAG TPA: DUF4349 domain-containing protein [Candidatus Obscuribacterales bacterium]
MGKLLVGLLSLTVVAGCSGAPLTRTEATSQSAPLAEAPLAAADSAMPPAETGTEGTGELAESAALLTDAPRSPQLVKQASLVIELADVEGAIATVSALLTQYQGDLLHLSDQARPVAEPRQVHLQLRVPQAQLDAVLKELRALGTVNTQTITAEDVATQLVDLQARGRNLRQSETALLAIMERSGSIAEVLEVSRELSTIRETIERSDAQLKHLQNQVAYATITLTLVSTEVPLAPASPVGATLSHTWQTATASLQTVSVSLLQLCLWLLAFSPYLGLLVLGGWAGRRYWRRPNSDVPSSQP